MPEDLDLQSSQLWWSDFSKTNFSLYFLFPSLYSLTTKEIPTVLIPPWLQVESVRQSSPFLLTGNPPLLLLPENVRIRKYNVSSEKFSEYLEEEEHIQTIDYDWDPEGMGVSEYKTCMHRVEFLVFQMMPFAANCPHDFLLPSNCVTFEPYFLYFHICLCNVIFFFPNMFISRVTGKRYKPICSRIQS